MGDIVVELALLAKEFSAGGRKSSLIESTGHCCARVSLGAETRTARSSRERER